MHDSSLPAFSFMVHVRVSPIKNYQLEFFFRTAQNIRPWVFPDTNFDISAIS